MTQLLKILGVVMFGMLPAFLFIGGIVLQNRRRDSRRSIPIDGNIPRPAGFSLIQRVEDLIWDIAFWLMALMGVGATIAYLCFFATPASQFGWWLRVAFALLFLTPIIMRCFKLVHQMLNYRLGLLGEQAVGGVLLQTMVGGCRVFHDFEVTEGSGKPWNIDHIVVGPMGVFCIETKTRRKVKSRGKKNEPSGWVASFDGNQIDYPWGWDRHGLDQAKRNAEWLRKFIYESAAEQVAVQAILVLPGWFVKRSGRGAVYVVNEKELAKQVSMGKPVLSAEQIQRISHQVHQRCRIPVD